MGLVVNDDNPAFDKFMLGYWNQMATEFYDTLSDALDDFEATDGDQLYQRLLKDIVSLHDAGRFPPEANLRSARRDKFWRKYDRVIVQEEVGLAVIESRRPT